MDLDYCTMPYEQGNAKLSYCVELEIDTEKRTVSGEVNLQFMEQTSFLSSPNIYTDTF